MVSAFFLITIAVLLNQRKELFKAHGLYVSPSKIYFVYLFFSFFLASFFYSRNPGLVYSRFYGFYFHDLVLFHENLQRSMLYAMASCALMFLFEFLLHRFFNKIGVCDFSWPQKKVGNPIPYDLVLFCGSVAVLWYFRIYFLHQEAIIKQYGLLGMVAKFSIFIVLSAGVVRSVYMSYRRFNFYILLLVIYAGFNLFQGWKFGVFFGVMIFLYIIVFCHKTVVSKFYIFLQCTLFVMFLMISVKYVQSLRQIRHEGKELSFSKLKDLSPELKESSALYLRALHRVTGVGAAVDISDFVSKNHPEKIDLRKQLLGADKSVEEFTRKNVYRISHIDNFTIAPSLPGLLQMFSVFDGFIIIFFLTLIFVLIGRIFTAGDPSSGVLVAFYAIFFFGAVTEGGLGVLLGVVKNLVGFAMAFFLVNLPALINQLKRLRVSRIATS